MIIAPRPLTDRTLTRGELSDDKRKCLKIGPCGLGDKAIYLNSFYIDRIYYVPYTEVARVFKRVAMSKGGYSGKGMFGSMPYLVVRFKNGQEKQCNFKYEDQVDALLDVLRIQHPEIKLMSESGEKRLAEAEAAEQARYVKYLSEQAEASIRELNEAKETLNEIPASYTRLSHAARQKRTIDNINPTYRAVALVILLMAAASAAFGLYAMIRGGFDYAVYFVLFGFAGVFFAMATRVLPTGRNNRRFAQREWDEARSAMANMLAGERSFPLPAQYAHPVVIDRMIRVIREGRAETPQAALETVKADLRALNSDVTVSQREYDEVVKVKPMFLVSNYK